MDRTLLRMGSTISKDEEEKDGITVPRGLWHGAFLSFELTLVGQLLFHRETATQSIPPISLGPNTPPQTQPTTTFIEPTFVTLAQDHLAIYSKPMLENISAPVLTLPLPLPESELEEIPLMQSAGIQFSHGSGLSAKGKQVSQSGSVGE